MSIQIESKISPLVVPESLEWEDFVPYLAGVNLYQIGGIAFAFEVAKDAHAGQFRKSGEPYFSHPLMVAIYAITAGSNNPDIIKASLLHDVLEDNKRYFPDAITRINQGYRDLRLMHGFRDTIDQETLLSRHLGQAASEIIEFLTKLPESEDPEEKKEEERGYLHMLEVAAPSGAWVVKAADRLHNLRTLPIDDPSRVARKIRETREGYLPIFKMAAEEFPIEGRYLLDHINIELKRLEIGRSYSPQF